MKLLLRLTLTLFTMIGPLLGAAAVKVEHYAKKDGLAGTVVSDIMQDSRGYMWIGTWEGLSRFDGKEFINYTEGNISVPDYMHNRIVKVHEDSIGNIWAMMYDDRLFRINRLTDTFDPMAEVFPDFLETRMYNPLFASNGDVLAEARGKGIVRFNAKQPGNTLKSELIPFTDALVIFLHQDGKGTIWAATDKGLYRVNVDSMLVTPVVKQLDVITAINVGDKVIWGCSDGSLIEVDCATRRHNAIPLAIGSGVTALSASPDKRTLYVGTSDNGLYAYNLAAKSMTPIPVAANSVEKLFTDSHERLWIITERQGVSMFDPKADRVSHFTQEVLPSSYEPSPQIVETPQGEVWVAMNGGGFGRYEPADDTIDYFHNDLDSPGALSNVVLQFAVTSPDVVWLATHRRGLDRITPIIDNVRHTWMNEHPHSLVDNEVKSFFLDGDTIVWAATKSGEINGYTVDARFLRRYADDASGKPIGRVYSMTRDRNGDLWLGTRGNGVVRMWRDASGKLCSRRYTHSPDDKYSISSNEVQSIVTDSAGRLWIGTYGGGVNLVLNDETVEGVRFLSHDNTMRSYPIASCSKVRSLATHPDGTIWAGTTEGLVSLTYDESTKDVKATVYRQDGENPHSLSSDDIVTVFVDSRDELWVGTMSGGLNHFEGMKAGKPFFTVYSTANGMSSNHIKSIIEGHDGNLWVATDENIVMYNADTETFSVYLEGGGATENTIFSENAALILPSGRPLFGANNGVYRVDVDNIDIAAQGSLNLRITGIEIDGNDTSPRVNPSSKLFLPEAGTVKLRSRNEALTVKFNSLNYILQSRVRYKAMLSGVDTAWVNLGIENSVTYTDLPAGTHTLTIRAFLSVDPEVMDETSIIIIVPRPWWAIWWVWLIIIAAVAGAAWGIVTFRRKRQVSPAPIPDSPRNRLAEIKPKQVEQDYDDDAFVKTLMEWMEANYQNPEMKIDDMVMASGVGRTTFYTKLRTLFNASPVEFVIDFRMKKAKMFIENTSRTVAEIAYLTGYVDPHYFTRAFKSHFGETPTHYRRHHPVSSGDTSSKIC